MKKVDNTKVKSERPVLSVKKPISILDLKSLKNRFETDEVVYNIVQFLMNDFTRKLEIYLKLWLNNGKNEAKIADITIDEKKIYYTFSKNAFPNDARDNIAVKAILNIANRSQNY